jgi:hypothetical protein
MLTDYQPYFSQDKELPLTMETNIQSPEIRCPTKSYGRVKAFNHAILAVSLTL